MLLESGGMTFDAKTQALYDGAEAGAPYLTLEASRLRYLGGSTNIWGGWCRPMDDIDFEERTWMPYSGWPFGRKANRTAISRAPSRCAKPGPGSTTRPRNGRRRWGRCCRSARAASSPAGSSSARCAAACCRPISASAMPTISSASAALRLSARQRHAAGARSPAARKIDELDVATLSGRKFKVKPKVAVLAMGAVEIARLMLASNDVMPAGVGNAHDLVGRFFADHPIPRDTATLVLFDGKLAPFYLGNQTIRGAIVRAGLFPSEKYRRAACGDGLLDHHREQGRAGRSGQGRGGRHRRRAGRRRRQCARPFRWAAAWK